MSNRTEQLPSHPDVLRPSSIAYLSDEIVRSVIVGTAAHSGQEYASGVEYMLHPLIGAVDAKELMTRLCDANSWSYRLVTYTVGGMMVHDSPEDTCEVRSPVKRANTSFPIVDLTYILSSGTPLPVGLSTIAVTKRVGQSRDQYNELLVNPTRELFFGVTQRDQELGRRLLSLLSDDEVSAMLELVGIVAPVIKHIDRSFNSNPWKIELLHDIDRDAYIMGVIGESAWSNAKPVERESLREHHTPAFHETVAKRQERYHQDFLFCSSVLPKRYGGIDFSSEAVEANDLSRPWRRATHQSHAVPASHYGALSVGLGGVA